MTREDSAGSFGVRQAVSVALAALLVMSPAVSVAKAGDPAAPALGAVSISTNPPGAAVYLDGQYAGKTPMNRDRLPAGDHRVRLVKDGYLENGRVVNIGTGQPTKIEVALTPQTISETALAGQQVRRPTPAAAAASPSGSPMSKKTLLLGAAIGAGGAGAAGYFLLHNHRPTPGAISVSPTGTGMAGATSFTFTAQGANDRNGDSLTYTWTFGDGATGTGATTSHTYAAAGSYAAHVTVSDEKSSASPPDVTVTVAASMGPTPAWTGGIEPGFNTPFTLTPSQVTPLPNGTGTFSGSAFFGGNINTTVNIAGSVTSLAYPATVSFSTASLPCLNICSTFVVSFTGFTNGTGTAMTGTLVSTPSPSGSLSVQTAPTTLSR